MECEITAYRIGHADTWSIEPASARREWLQQTPHKGANRCLPLVMACQAGWVLRCGMRFAVTWSGKNTPESLTFDFPEHEERAKGQILSLFGSGIVSFSIPWLFRTTKDIALLVRGPTNFYKENVVPLDGLVETDWAPYTFTMNWKVVKPRTKIWFRADDPICMFMPYPIGLLANCRTDTKTIKDDPELFDQFLAWRQQRATQINAIQSGTRPEEIYSLDYIRGAKPDGTFAGAHYSNLKLAKFEGARD